MRSWLYLQNGHHLSENLQHVDVIPSAYFFLHFLSRNELLGVGHLTVSTGTYLVTDIRLKVHEYCTLYVLVRACLGKKRRKRVVAMPMDVIRNRTIKLDSMFETLDVIAGIYRLVTALAKMT